MDEEPTVKKDFGLPTNPPEDGAARKALAAAAKAEELRAARAKVAALCAGADAHARSSFSKGEKHGEFRERKTAISRGRGGFETAA
jgi:hypothetical protein